MDKKQKRTVIILSIIATIIFIIALVYIICLQIKLNKERDALEDREYNYHNPIVETSPFYDAMLVDEESSFDICLLDEYVDGKITNIEADGKFVELISKNDTSFTIKGKKVGVGSVYVKTIINNEEFRYKISDIYVNENSYDEYSRINNIEDYYNMINSNPKGKYILNSNLDFKDKQYLVIDEFNGVLLNPNKYIISNINITLNEKRHFVNEYGRLDFDKSIPITSFLFKKFNGYVEGLIFDKVNIKLSQVENGITEFSLTYGFGIGNIKDISFSNTIIDFEKCGTTSVFLTPVLSSNNIINSFNVDLEFNNLKDDNNRKDWYMYSFNFNDYDSNAYPIGSSYIIDSEIKIEADKEYLGVLFNGFAINSSFSGINTKIYNNTNIKIN